MDLRESPEEAAFRERVRDWLAENVPDEWRAVRGRGLGALEDALGGPDEALAFAKAWQRKLYDAGFLGLQWPTEFGGQGLGPVEQFIYTEEYVRAKPPPLINTIGLGWAGPAILLHGTEAQKERYLEPLLRGEEIWCQLFSEPGAGSDLAGLGTKAVRSDSGFVLNGQKVWTSYAREADFGICVARTDPDVPKHRGLSFFVVPMDARGIEIRPIRQMNDAADFNEVFLTDVEISADHLVGELNDGWRVVISTLLAERIGLSLGAGALWGQGPDADDLAGFMSARVDGRPAPIEDPVLRERLASVYVDAVAHRLLKLRLVTKAARGEMPGAEASIQKLFGDEWGQRMTELGVEAQGLWGPTWDPDETPASGAWQGSFLFSPALTIGGGTTEVQKNIIGERLLGLPKEPTPR